MTGGGTGASDDCIRIPTPGRQTGYKRASMRIVLRVAVVLLVVSIPAGAAAHTKPKPKPSAHACRPAVSACCLRRARGAEPVIVSAAGRISRGEALQAFVQIVGPLPGIKAQSGAVAPRASHSASGPLRWAASFLPSMTKAQRAAFRTLISLRPPSRRAHVAAVPPKATTQTWTKGCRAGSASARSPARGKLPELRGARAGHDAGGLLVPSTRKAPRVWWSIVAPYVGSGRLPAARDP
jgi:hypothetical protein